MKKRLFILGVLFASCILNAGVSAASEMSLTYHSYAREGAGGRVLAETLIKFKDLPGGQTALSRHKQIGGERTDDEFLLDREYSLLKWTRTCVGKDTKYASERKGNFFVVKGKLNGKDIDKKIKLDSRPLYIYPKYSLTKFVLSGLKKIKFWTLRRDTMDKLLMQAKKKGEETIMINGKKIKAVKVYYSITGKLREKHYYRNYYYRKSDGLFIKKEEPRGRVEELVKEK